MNAIPWVSWAYLCASTAMAVILFDLLRDEFERRDTNGQVSLVLGAIALGLMWPIILVVLAVGFVRSLVGKDGGARW